MYKSSSGHSKPTIKMIAERAGVSRGTVDRVINNRPGVKYDSREKVLAAVRDLHYISHRLDKLSALGGVSKHSPCSLGVLIPYYAAANFEENVERGIRDASDALSPLGVEVHVERCETQLVDESLEKLDALVHRGVRGVAMTAININRVARRIDSLAEAGIPVITYNSDIPQSKRVCFVGEDSYQSGRIAGNLINRMLTSRSDTILAVVGNRGFEGHAQRLTGFMDYMTGKGAEVSDIQIIETYNDYMTTFQRVHEALSTNSSIGAIYLANESVAGCVEAIDRLNLSRHIACVCHDLSPVSRRVLKAGTIDFVITQDMYQQGYQPLILLHQLVENGKKDVGYTLPRTQILCSENLPD